jgi:hypothetical protein
MIYVIAGNSDEYHSYIRTKNNSIESYRYVRDEDSIRGIENPDGVFIGSWRKRKDIKVLMVALLVSMRDQKKREALKQLMNKEFGMFTE